MTKQLLIYEKVVPLSKDRHRDWYVKTGKNYKFAQSVNAMPLTAIEFPKAALEYTIIFTGKQDSGVVMPAIVLGLRNEENIFVQEDGRWESRYIPAFARRYPFVFSGDDEGKTFTLCLDEEFEGCNQEGRGERLFDSEGEQTQYLKGILGFVKEYQGQFQRTQTFCNKLKEHNLLEPIQAELTLKTGEQMSLGGFMAVSREKLKELTGEQLVELTQTNELELIYLHLQSLQNLPTIAERLPQNRLEGNPEEDNK